MRRHARRVALEGRRAPAGRARCRRRRSSSRRRRGPVRQASGTVTPAPRSRPAKRRAVAGVEPRAAQPVPLRPRAVEPFQVAAPAAVAAAASRHGLDVEQPRLRAASPRDAGRCGAADRGGPSRRRAGAGPGARPRARSRPGLRRRAAASPKKRLARSSAGDPLGGDVGAVGQAGAIADRRRGTAAWGSPASARRRDQASSRRSRGEPGVPVARAAGRGGRRAGRGARRRRRRPGSRRTPRRGRRRPSRPGCASAHAYSEPRCCERGPDGGRDVAPGDDAGRAELPRLVLGRERGGHRRLRTWRGSWRRASPSP